VQFIDSLVEQPIQNQNASEKIAPILSAVISDIFVV